MIDSLEGLPALDTHAHIATDVTAKQAQALGHSYTFAVTRSLTEASRVPWRWADKLTWGVGVHPGVAAAQSEYDEKVFAELLPRFSLIGEVGLDRRAGNLPRQISVLKSILGVAARQPVLISMHSSGAASEVLDVLEQNPHPGVILHWWTDDGINLERALATGAYFSVNGATKSTVLERLPSDRILTETDFPARKAGSRRPGDTRDVEGALSKVWGATGQATRHRVWANMRRLVTKAEALDRLPEQLADIVESV